MLHIPEHIVVPNVIHRVSGTPRSSSTPLSGTVTGGIGTPHSISQHSSFQINANRGATSPFSSTTLLDSFSASPSSLQPARSRSFQSLRSYSDLNLEQLTHPRPRPLDLPSDLILNSSTPSLPQQIPPPSEPSVPSSQHHQPRPSRGPSSSASFLKKSWRGIRSIMRYIFPQKHHTARYLKRKLKSVSDAKLEAIALNSTRRLRLMFPDTIVESAFMESYCTSTLKTNKITLAAFTLFYALVPIRDFFIGINDDDLTNSIVGRISAVSAVAIGIATMYYSPSETLQTFWRRWNQFYAMLVAINFTFVTILLQSDSNPLFLFAGVMVILLCSQSVLRMRFAYALTTALIIFLSFNTAPFISIVLASNNVGDEYGMDLIQADIYLITAAAMGIVNSFVSERNARKDFLRELEIERKREHGLQVLLALSQHTIETSDGQMNQLRRRARTALDVAREVEKLHDDAIESCQRLMEHYRGDEDDGEKLEQEPMETQRLLSSCRNTHRTTVERLNALLNSTDDEHDDGAAASGHYVESMDLNRGLGNGHGFAQHEAIPILEFQRTAAELPQD